MVIVHQNQKVDTGSPLLLTKDEVKTDKVVQSSRVFFDVATDEEALGRVVLELDVERAPKTCSNFLALCTGSHKHAVDKRLFFKDTLLYRIVPDVYICGGDVINNNGTSGMSIYGQTFDDERTGLKHDRPGVLSMLGHGPNTNNSQFFVTLTATPWMDEFYVAFGHVAEGLNLLKELSENFGTESGIPSANIYISNCGQL